MHVFKGLCALKIHAFLYDAHLPFFILYFQEESCIFHFLLLLPILLPETLSMKVVKLVFHDCWVVVVSLRAVLPFLLKSNGCK